MTNHLIPSDFNATMRKFGAPHTIIRSYQHWSVLLRPAQVTLGSLVLAAHEPATAFSQLSAASFTELHEVTRAIETALSKAFHYDKINYLMLMMVDHHVHLHVIPRYQATRQFAGVDWVDNGWPAFPVLADRQHSQDAEVLRRMRDALRSAYADLP